jgi:ankyrin repeat protein
LVFADAHCLEAGIDGFFEAIEQSRKHDEDSVVELDDLKRAGLEISVDWRGSAPASMSFGTQSALSGLADHAKSGGFDTSFELDGTSYEGIGCGRRKSSKGLPPRHYRWDIYFAAQADDAKALKALAADKVSLAVTYPHRANGSALHVAAESGALASVQALLAANIAADVTNDNDDAPLAFAATADVARALLAAGATVDGKREDRTPLESAFFQSRWDAHRKGVVEVLLAAGAKIRKAAHAEIVDRCATLGWIDILHRLVEIDRSITKVFAKTTIMESAIDGGDPVLVDLLLEHGGKLPDDFFERAVDAGAIALAETALRTPGVVKAKGAEAVGSAAGNGDVPMLELLVAHSAPLVAKPGQPTPLHRANRNDNDKDKLAATVRWLLDHGVPIEATDEEGRTALVDAVRSYEADKAIILMELGADPSGLDALETDTIEYVAEKGGARWKKALASARKTFAKPIAAKTATRPAPIKKTSTKKAATKKPSVKKSAKKSPVNKASTKKSAAKKTASKKKAKSKR